MSPGYAPQTDGASLAYRTLLHEPDFSTPARIANGPFAIDQVTEEDVRAGLLELEAAGWAVQLGGRWALTDKARARYSS